jgi:hypothetical protein
MVAAPATIKGTSVRLGRPDWRRRWTVHARSGRTFRIPIPLRAAAVRVQVSPTFSPADYGSQDTRQLRVQAAFSFEPRQ